MSLHKTDDLRRSKGLPKKTEQFFFFQIDDGKVKEFRTALANLIPLIRTAAQALDDQKKIEQSQKEAGDKGVTPPLLKLSGVNIGFTQAGLKLVSLAAVVYWRDWHSQADIYLVFDWYSWVSQKILAIVPSRLASLPVRRVLTIEVPQRPTTSSIQAGILPSSNRFMV